jgi:hypothetical protein
LHYRRDVTLREDATRFKQPALAKSIATINNFVIGLTQKLGYTNLASPRRLLQLEFQHNLLLNLGLLKNPVYLPLLSPGFNDICHSVSGGELCKLRTMNPTLHGERL